MSTGTPRKANLRNLWTCFVVFLMLIVTGCEGNCPVEGQGLGSTCGQTESGDGSTGSGGSTSGSGSTTGGSTGSGNGQLFAANGAAGTITRYANATTLNGNVVPTATLTGALTRLSGPAYLTLDTANDRLYVPNTGDNSILVFNSVSTLNQNAPPARFLQGNGTNLNRPLKVQIDPGRDELYVANGGSNGILVFSNASTIQGNVAPVRTLQGGSTQLSGLRSFVLDASNNRLFAVSETGNSILVWDSISTRNGDVPPTRIISGGGTGLSQPQDLLLTGDRLFVSNAGDASILRFENASTLSGNVAFTARIQGTGTTLQRPGQLALDTNRNELYVADTGANAVDVFTNASTANGAPIPPRRLTGSNTALNGPTGIALDLTR